MSDILERKVIYGGETFIKEGQEHGRAYIVQQGLIRSFIEEDGAKVYIQDYGPGRLIAETCLMSDEPMPMSYEAIENTTVVTLTRQDFQKKIARIDEGIAKVLEHVMMKLNYQYSNDLEGAKKQLVMDEEAQKIIQALLANMPEDRRFKYERAILPHVNAIVSEIRALKEEDAKETV